MAGGRGGGLEEAYALEGTLGRGAYGTVFRARRREDGHACACKRIALGSLSESLRGKALQEAELLRQLDCPWVVSYLDSFLEGDELCIVTELCEGGTLAGLLARQAPGSGAGLAEDTVARYSAQVLLGLSYLHGRRVLHRDVKPANVFLFRGGGALLGDLGVAKVLLCTAEKAHTVVGSPAYMAPELVDAQPYGAGSDIWALGCVAFEMCALHRPFQAPNVHALCVKILKGQPPALPSRYSPRLQVLVSRCLCKLPSHRPTAEELLRARPLCEVQLPVPQRRDALHVSRSNSVPPATRRSSLASSGNADQRRGSVQALLNQFSTFATDVHDTHDIDLDELKKEVAENLEMIKDMMEVENHGRQERDAALQKRCDALEKALAQHRPSESDKKRLDHLENMFAAWADKNTRDVESIRRAQESLGKELASLEGFTSAAEQTAKALAAAKSKLDHLHENVLSCEQHCTAMEHRSTLVAESVKSMETKISVTNEEVEIKISKLTKEIETVKSERDSFSNQVTQKLSDTNNLINQHVASQNGRLDPLEKGHNDLLARHDGRSRDLKGLKDDHKKRSQELRSLRKRVDDGLGVLADSTARELKATRKDLDRLRASHDEVSPAISSKIEHVQETVNVCERRVTTVETKVQETERRLARIETNVRHLQDETGRHNQDLGSLRQDLNKETAKRGQDVNILRQHLDGALGDISQNTAREIKASREDLDQVLALLPGVQRQKRISDSGASRDSSPKKLCSEDVPKEPSSPGEPDCQVFAELERSHGVLPGAGRSSTRGSSCSSMASLTCSVLAGSDLERSHLEPLLERCERNLRKRSGAAAVAETAASAGCDVEITLHPESPDFVQTACVACKPSHLRGHSLETELDSERSGDDVAGRGRCEAVDLCPPGGELDSLALSSTGAASTDAASAGLGSWRGEAPAAPRPPPPRLGAGRAFAAACCAAGWGAEAFAAEGAAEAPGLDRSPCSQPASPNSAWASPACGAAPAACGLGAGAEQSSFGMSLGAVCSLLACEAAQRSGADDGWAKPIGRRRRHSFSGPDSGAGVAAASAGSCAGGAGGAWGRLGPGSEVALPLSPSPSQATFLDAVLAGAGSFSEASPSQILRPHSKRDQLDAGRTNGQAPDASPVRLGAGAYVLDLSGQGSLLNESSWEEPRGASVDGGPSLSAVLARMLKLPEARSDAECKGCGARRQADPGGGRTCRSPVREQTEGGPGTPKDIGLRHPAPAAAVAASTAAAVAAAVADVEGLEAPGGAAGGAGAALPRRGRCRPDGQGRLLAPSIAEFTPLGRFAASAAS